MPISSDTDVSFSFALSVLELVEVIEPEPEVLEAEWQEARADNVEAARQRAITERQLDYFQYMSERAQHTEGIVMRHNDAINEILGINDTEFIAPSDDAILDELTGSSSSGSEDAAEGEETEATDDSAVVDVETVEVSTPEQ